MTDSRISSNSSNIHLGSRDAIFANQHDAVDAPRSLSRFVRRSMASSDSFNPPKDTAGGEIDPLYAQLWHACAGPLVSLPCIGGRNVYFPQGHIEQVAACTNQEVDLQMPHHNLPPEILCRVINMTLSAEKETDEVYAQMTLVPEGEKIDLTEDVEEEPPFCPKQNVHMFIKSLTPSDTSTHGGFSVPRRAAEECFPPLDYQQSPPTQDLIAKDLHGIEWRFRHIYRGHPKRHLLTTGWSVFVGQKRLVPGDCVIFLRGENGDLRIGVRRAVRQQSSVTSSSLLSSHSMQLGVLAAAAHAVSTKTMCSIFYNPRTSPAEFVVPYYKYVNSFKRNLSVGMRFKMRFETEDSSERRYIGTITGVGDMDSLRWPNSNWRCLKVNWDEQIASERQERLSPWEIEPYVAAASGTPSEPRITRLRFSTPPSIDAALLRDSSGRQLDLAPLIHNHGAWPLGVSRGTEDEGCSKRSTSESWTQVPKTELIASDRFSIWKSAFNQEFQAPSQVPVQHEQQQKFKLPKSKAPGFPYPFAAKSTGLEQLNDSQQNVSEVAQIVRSTHERPQDNPEAYESRKNPTAHWMMTNSSFVPASPASIDHKKAVNWLAFSESPSYAENNCEMAVAEVSSPSHPKHETSQTKSITEPCSLTVKASQDKDSNHSPQQVDQSCKLFGFDLIGGPAAKTNHTTRVAACPLDVGDSTLTGFNSPTQHEQVSTPWAPVRNRIKVYKQGAIGRAVDLSKFEGYDDLRQILGDLFGIPGVLSQPESGWELVYTDHEGDLLLVGDDPWPEFCVVVRKIRILAPAEVEQLEQAAPLNNSNEDDSIRETSKCSSDHQDSNPATPKGRLLDA